MTGVQTCALPIYCWPPSFASARYRESVATNRLYSEPNLTERLYEEEKRRTNALLFRFFSKLLERFLSEDRDAAKQPPLTRIEICACVQGTAVVPQHEVTWTPNMFVDKAPLLLVVK